MDGLAVRALDGVTFTVEDGEFVAIMGPSGSGKSTLMYILGCLDRPSSGRYEIDGVPVDQLSDDDLAQIRNRYFGFVFQNYNLIPRLPALQQVELPLVYRGDPDRRRRAEQALIAVGLGDRLRHRPTELSGGQQQRVGIARALVTEPQVILADEPTGNLDTQASIEILDILEHLNQERGITVIIVTHEPMVAERVHRVITMRDGRIIGDRTQQPATARLRAVA
jgi:putative ABC transport system ATP-binding protein